jgi:hypothetical protein
MRLRLSSLLFAILLAAPLGAAFVPGTVFIQNTATNSSLGLNSREMWVYSPGDSYALGTGTPLIYQMSPLGEGPFLIRTPNAAIFERSRIISVWDGIERYYGDPVTGIQDILSSDVDLAEIAPARSGNFVVAEQWNTPEVGAKLVEFNLGGAVAEYNLPTIADVAHNRVLGAHHIEVLGDGCTVLYTLGHDDPNPGRVHRFNICTGAAESDFWVPTVSTEYAGSLRQIPNGDVLVAFGTGIRELTLQGVPVHEWAFAGVTHLALTPDGHAFYAAGLDHQKADFRLYQLDTPSDPPQLIPLGNPEMQSLLSPAEILELVVVGEWRAVGVTARTRAVRHR